MSEMYKRNPALKDVSYEDLRAIFDDAHKLYGLSWYAMFEGFPKKLNIPIDKKHSDILSTVIIDMVEIEIYVREHEMRSASADQ